MAVAAAELNYLDKGFAMAEEPEAGSPIPDGIYKERVDGVEVRNSQKSGKLGLAQELIILEGPYEGRKHFRWSNIPDVPTNEEEKARAMQSLGFLKKDLRNYGINIDAPGFSLSGFLSSNIGALLDRIVEVQVKTNKKGETNIYINKLISAPGGAGEVSVPGGDGYDPFADE